MADDDDSSGSDFVPEVEEIAAEERVKKRKK